MSMKILLVEDDKEQASAIQLALELFNPGDTFIHLTVGGGAPAVIANESPDLVLLDLGLPDEDGLTTLQNIRSISRIPVIVVSARSGMNSIVKLLEAGADDYLVKPFNAVELQARIRAVMRRSKAAPGSGSSIAATGYAINFDRRDLKVYGSFILLSRNEWEILLYLWRNRPRVVETGELRQFVWRRSNVSDAAISMAISRLRRKLGPAAELVKSERGAGYCFEMEIANLK
jgi:DNA-binding response OmpR family regulator